MHTFVDSKGETWDLCITAGTIKRCADLLKVDLGDPMRGDPPLLTRFDTDIMFMVDLLWAICKPLAKEKQVDEEQFAERLSGDALQSAHDAFYEELLDFFRSLHKTNVVEAIKRQREIIAAGVEKGRAMLASEKTTEAILQALTGLGEDAADLLASSAVTRSREPTAS